MIQCFTKAVPHYDREAVVQGICAKKMGDYLARQTIPDGPVLEIGCGTGFVTKEIVRCFRKRPLFITDICPAMLEKCRSNVGTGTFALLDGEQFHEEGKYSLIVSGLAFQWFYDFTASVKKLYGGLKPGGLLLFSFVEAKSFPEWRQICREQNLMLTANDLPSLFEVPDAVIWEEKITLTYPDALNCLKGFKQIGANASLKGKQLPLPEFRRLLSYWDASCPDGVTLTYNIGYAAMWKW